MTSHDRSGISRERGSHPRWQQQRQRPLLDLPARLLQCCEVHEYIFSVITSGVICVLKLCYALALHQTHILMTCTCNCSMHISAHAALLHAHFTTCNCSMHIQHMQLLHAHSAPARTRSGSPHNVLHSPSIALVAYISIAFHSIHTISIVYRDRHRSCYLQKQNSRHVGVPFHILIFSK